MKGGKGEGVEVEVEVDGEDEVDVEGEGIWASVRVKWDRYPSKDVHNTKSGVEIVKRITIPPAEAQDMTKNVKKVAIDQVMCMCALFQHARATLPISQ